MISLAVVRVFSGLLHVNQGERQKLGHLHHVKRVPLQAEEGRGDKVLVGFLVIRLVHVAQLRLLFGREGMKFDLLGPFTHRGGLLVQLGQCAG